MSCCHTPLLIIRTSNFHVSNFHNPCFIVSVTGFYLTVDMKPWIQNSVSNMSSETWINMDQHGSTWITHHLPRFSGDPQVFPGPRVARRIRSEAEAWSAFGDVQKLRQVGGTDVVGTGGEAWSW